MTREERLHLLEGEGLGPFESETKRREAWETHRAELMAERLQEGKLPAGFWQYDAREPRQMVGNADYWLTAGPYRFGVPSRRWIRPQYRDDHLVPLPLFEAETAYLRRLGLSLPLSLDKHKA